MIALLARRQQRLTLGMAVIDLGLVAVKIGLGVATGSLALLSDAVHSGLDAAASILAFIAVRAASRPADREHPYGHGKAENLAAYTEGFLLVIAGLVIGFEAVQHLFGQGYRVDASPLALGFLVFTIILEVGRTTVLRQVAARTNSASIGALATDKLADLMSVTAVLLGLVAVRFGFVDGDSVAALVVAGLILRAAIQLIRSATNVLMDRSVSAVERDVLAAASGVEGVREVRAARVRQSGAHMIGEVEVAGRPTLPLEAAQGLADRVREAVRKRVPALELNVYVASGGDPTRLVERVHAAAARNGAFRDLHDVVVEREADESLHLSLHAKLPGSISVREATRFAHQLEGELRTEFPEVSRVDIHLEPLEPDVVYGRNVTAQHADLVKIVRSVVTADGRVISCDDVELSSRGGEITAYVDVTVADDLTLEQAHDIETSLEEGIRQAVPSLKRVVVRALG
jgi:cation diffusion facilitator family transporter